MKNYLIAIDNEIQDSYNLFIENSSHLELNKNSKELCDNIISIFDYYVEPIFKNGKNITCKKLNLLSNNEFTDDEVSYIENFKVNFLNYIKDTLQIAIISCFENRKSDKDLFDQIIEIIISYCLKLFKYAQLSEFKNNGINEIYIMTDNNSCMVCQTKSKFKYNVNELMQNINDIHPFCKLIFEYDATVTNIDKQINYILTRLKIAVPNLITNYEFEIIEDISKEELFINELRLKYNDNQVENLLKQINGNIMSFKIKSKVLISSKYINHLEYIVVKSLLEDKLMNNDLTWWKEQFYSRQQNKYLGDEEVIYSKPFVNNMAEQNYESYFKESAISYILNPDLLKEIDVNNYNYLKSHIFNEMEFLKG